MSGSSGCDPPSDLVNIVDALVRAAARRPHHPALAFGPDDDIWTYRRLAAEVATISARLVVRGGEIGDRVAIVMPNWPEHVAAWFGAAHAGRIVVDLNTLVGDEEWKSMLADTTPVAVATSSTFAPRIEKILAEIGSDAEVWVVETPGDGFGATTEVLPPAFDVGPDGVAVVAYTSGTTGLPKGVMHTHDAVLRQAEILRTTLHHDEDSVFYVAVPLFALQAFVPLAVSSMYVGGTLVLAERFDPRALAAASRRWPITYITTSAPMLAMIIDLPIPERPVFPALKQLTSGGASLHAEVKERFEEALGVRVSQGYGMTEMLGGIVGDYRGGAPRGSCGRLYPEDPNLVAILDDDGNVVPPGEVGELSLARSAAPSGYWKRPDLMDEAFRDGWFRTGDIARVDADGYFWIVDRKKDMIIRGGFNIFSAEIERVLNDHELVAESTVIGRPHERLGEVPVAYVVPIGGADRAEVAAVLAPYARERLGKLKTPEEIVVVDFDDLPRNAIGKVVKPELRELCARFGPALH